MILFNKPNPIKKYLSIVSISGVILTILFSLKAAFFNFFLKFKSNNLNKLTGILKYKGALNLKNESSINENKDCWWSKFLKNKWGFSTEEVIDDDNGVSVVNDGDISIVWFSVSEDWVAIDEDEVTTVEDGVTNVEDGVTTVEDEVTVEDGVTTDEDGDAVEEYRDIYKYKYKMKLKKIEITFKYNGSKK